MVAEESKASNHVLKANRLIYPFLILPLLPLLLQKGAKWCKRVKGEKPSVFRQFLL
jgi:hypothetical protein